MKPTGPLEKVIESNVCSYARDLGCLCYKFTSPSRRSVPDRLFITPKGEVFFVEFKRAGQKPTAAQAVEIDKIKRQGVPVCVADTVEAGRVMVNAMMHGAEPDTKKKETAFCSVCGDRQFSTPSGITCPNGHGGAPSRGPLTLDDF